MAKVFIVDCNLCNGCHSCQIACKDEHCGNDWMPYARSQPTAGHFWYKLKEYERGSIGKQLPDTPQVRESSKVKTSYVPWLCQHCDDAPCIAACPNGSISKRDDGLVWIDPNKCKGTGLCMDACPYSVIYFNDSIKQAQKCTGCAHLLDRGWPIKEPRCVDACITGMLKFGEESEFTSDISEAERLTPKFGETPDTRIYYKNIPKKFIGGTVYDPNNKEVIIGATCTISGDASGTTTTDDFGDFWFEGLKTGSFSIKIEADGKSKTIDDINTEKDVNLGDIALS